MSTVLGGQIHVGFFIWGGIAPRAPLSYVPAGHLTQIQTSLLQEIFDEL